MHVYDVMKAFDFKGYSINKVNDETMCLVNIEDQVTCLFVAFSGEITEFTIRGEKSTIDVLLYILGKKPDDVVSMDVDANTKIALFDLAAEYDLSINATINKILLDQLKRISAL